MESPAETLVIVAVVFVLFASIILWVFV